MSQNHSPVAVRGLNIFAGFAAVNAAGRREIGINRSLCDRGINITYDRNIIVHMIDLANGGRRVINSVPG